MNPDDCQLPSTIPPRRIMSTREMFRRLYPMVDAPDVIRQAENRTQFLENPPIRMTPQMPAPVFGATMNRPATSPQLTYWRAFTSAQDRNANNADNNGEGQGGLTTFFQIMKYYTVGLFVEAIRAGFAYFF
ncbi:uncharacterized protein LOC111048590 [Nilaparvata lugens]|uniref:uncharacterized protein LOC111048590 n=1 Tax=Nilaparvata lugens TaxID=108931 RepID=UPI00193E956D|nr:uncharacterized protein LOC111048590 [Nilaparvata lugens]XP_039298464.1 uncharacterized protein LOC111048590 [Nilaparvata lugens]XP_039298465.1 uncharacterized protein LOC111048590 [Nilaparvata lugens]